MANGQFNCLNLDIYSKKEPILKSFIKFNEKLALFNILWIASLNP